MHSIAVPIEPDTHGIPGKVQAAQQYLHFAHGIRCPQSPFATGGDMPQSGIDLTAKEQACYDAATDLLMQYFRGEMDFGDTNPGTAVQHPPGDPQSPVLIS